jgi:hypothetical protein
LEHAFRLLHTPVLIDISQQWRLVGYSHGVGLRLAGLKKKNLPLSLWDRLLKHDFTKSACVFRLSPQVRLINDLFAADRSQFDAYLV